MKDHSDPDMEKVALSLSALMSRNRDRKRGRQRTRRNVSFQPAAADSNGKEN